MTRLSKAWKEKHSSKRVSNYRKWSETPTCEYLRSLLHAELGADRLKSV